MQSPEGYYLTGDAGYFDSEEYLYVMTRTDDVINVAGHRLSTGRLEEVLTGSHFVAECAVVGREDRLKGEVPIAFVIMQKEDGAWAKMEQELNKQIREKVGAFAKLDAIIRVKRLPKTRSGKILRNLLRDISNGVKSPRVAATIEDQTVVQEL